MSLIHIYNRSPKILQNLLLSIKSQSYQKHRRGKLYDLYLQQFMRVQWLHNDALQNLQINLFQDTFSEAYRNVTYYNRIFNEAGINPSEYTDIDDLSMFPIISKSNLRANTELFENTNRRTIYVSKTGGTTGAPMITPWDSDSLQYSIAIQDHYFQTVGIQYGLPCLYLTGQGIVPHSEKENYCRIDKSTNSIFPSVHHLSKSTINSYLVDIKKFNPVWGMGYTSFAYELASRIIDLDKCGEVRLAGFMGTSETAEPEMIHAIEKAFDTRFFDFYSSTEGIPFVAQCLAGNYHLHPTSGLIEFMNESGEKAAAGEPAKMIVTSFKNKKRPLLRYAIDDYAILRKDQSCPCGCQWLMIESIYGRRAEWVTNNQGKRISQFSHQVFKVIKNVKSSQIIQENTEKFIIKLVVEEKHRFEVEHRIKKRIPEVLGHHAEILFEYLQSIPRTNAGKRPTVISKV